MTKREAPDLQALRDTLAEDLLTMSREQRAAEFAADNVDVNAEADRFDALFKAALTQSKKAKLAAAKAGLGQQKTNANVVAIQSSDLISRFDKALKSGALNSLPVTLAARSGSEMSESDRQKMIEDMIELGIQLPDEE